MPTTPVPAAPFLAGTAGDVGPRQARRLAVAMEVVVWALFLVPLWAFGRRQAVFLPLMYAGVALLLALWALRMLVEGRLTWHRCPVGLCLAALAVLGIFQLTPLPRAVLETIAPGTARLYDRLLPAHPEGLADGESHPAGPAPAGSTLSLYPGATRVEVFRLLAVFLLFTVVRSNVPAAAGLTRFSVVMVVNGTLVALVALVQQLGPRLGNPSSWPWSLGPFAGVGNRNQFAFHLNLCIGLGVGLLFAAARLGRRGEGRPGDGPGWPSGPSFGSGRGPLGLALLRPRLLSSPGGMWVGFALVLMIVAAVAAQSRGGFLALLGGAAVGLPLLLRFQRLRLGGLAIGAVVVVVLSLGLLAWIHFRWDESRFTALLDGKVLDDGGSGRAQIWERGWRWAEECPLWGTGSGTFPSVEGLGHTDLEGLTPLTGYRAHNQYLEALVEGGVLRLGIVLLAVALVFRLGWRAASRNRGRPVAAVAVGALFAFTTVVLHSFVDPPLHSPVHTVPLAVCLACLCALGREESGRPSGARTLRLGGLAPVAGAGLAVALGLLVAVEAWKEFSVSRLVYGYRAAAGATPPCPEGQLALLEEAARLWPDNARMQVELGQLYEDRYRAEAVPLGRSHRLAVAAHGVLALCPGDAGQLARVPAWLAAAAWRERLFRRDVDGAARRHLVPALRHYLLARDACPLLAKPQVRLAAHVGLLEGADPRSAYLARAGFLAPFDPELAYLCGLQEVADGHPERAWTHWHRSVQAPAQDVVRILETSARLLAPEAPRPRVLPKAPAARPQPPWRAFAAQRRLFQEQALAGLARRQGTWNAERLHLKAMLHGGLDQPAAAERAYRAALALEPLKTPWRRELATVLARQGRLVEARRELEAALRQEYPNLQDRLAAAEREVDRLLGQQADRVRQPGR
jgi:O-antigen ligase